MELSDVPAWAQQLLTVIGASGAVYGGIRADIKAMHQRIATLESSLAEAHDRIFELAKDTVRNIRR